MSGNFTPLNLFTMTDLSGRLGITPRQLQWWDEQNIVRANNHLPRTSVKIMQTREYTFEQAMRAGIVKELHASKFIRARRKPVLDRISKLLVRHPLARFLIVTTTGNAHQVDKKEEVLADMCRLRSPGKLIDVDEIRMKLGRRMS